MTKQRKEWKGFVRGYRDFFLKNKFCHVKRLWKGSEFVQTALIQSLLVSFSGEKSTRLDKELKHGLLFLFLFPVFLLKEKNCSRSLNIYTTHEQELLCKLEQLHHTGTEPFWKLLRQVKGDK